MVANTTTKSPGIAAVLEAILPGAGIMYAGFVNWGLGILAATAAAGFFAYTYMNSMMSGHACLLNGVFANCSLPLLLSGTESMTSGQPWTTGLPPTTTEVPDFFHLVLILSIIWLLVRIAIAARTTANAMQRTNV